MAEKFVLTAQLNLQAPTNVKQVLGSMKKDLQSVSVDVNVKQGAQAVKQLNQVAKATKQVEKSAKGAETGADRMGKAFGSALKNVLRYDLARRVFSAFTNTIEQGIQDAIKFEREMIKIAQVSGLTTKQLKGLERSITNLSTSLGVSSAGLAKIGLILKQTGLSINDTRIAMEALAKTELAPTFDNITNTAETAVAAMRQFRIEASQLEVLLSKINTVAANFAVEASDIGVAIKRAGGAFRSAGGEVEELIALFTSVRATTRETAETIATGFRTIFTRMQRPTTIKFMRQFGVELTNLNGQFVGPYEAVKRLSNALQGLESTDLRFSAIVEQLGGFRQVSKVIPLIQEFSTAQAAYKAQLQGTDSLAKDAEKAQQSLAIQIMKLTENVKELFREIANSTAFKEMAKFALMLANAAVQLGKALAPIIPMLGAMMAFKAAGWAGGKLFSGGAGGLNRAMGAAGGGASDAFKGSRGGRVPKRFSGGGWVGGSGSGDTVPAMLEPGEFVLRKSAAQAYGPQLNGINKYAKGGKALTTGKQLNAMQTVSGLFSTRGKKNWSKRAGREWKTTGKTIDQFGLEDNFEIQNNPMNITLTPESLTGRGAIVNKIKTGSAVQKGAAWEKLLKSTGRLQGFGGSSPPLDGTLAGSGAGTGKTGDASWSNTTHSSEKMANKAFRHLYKGNKSGLLNAMNTHVGKDDFKLADLGMGEVSEFIPSTATKKFIKEFGTPAATARKNKKATGGSIGGSGAVPSLLTPGEFVVNKKSAQSIGYGKLRGMNKYAGGGTVQRFQGGGSPIGGGGMGGMMMPMMMSNMMESTGKATKGVYSMGEGAFQAFFKLQVMSAGVDMAMNSMGQSEGAIKDFTDVLMKAALVLGTVKGAMGKGGGVGMLDKAVNVGMLASMGKGSGVGGAVKRFGGKTLAGAAQGTKGIATKGLFWKQVMKREAIATKAATRVAAIEKGRLAAINAQAKAEKNLRKLTKQRAKDAWKIQSRSAAAVEARGAEGAARSKAKEMMGLRKSNLTEAGKLKAEFGVGKRGYDPRYAQEAPRNLKSAKIAGKEMKLQGGKALKLETSAANLSKNLKEADRAIIAQKEALKKSTATIKTAGKKIPALTKMGKAARVAATALKSMTVVALVAEVAVDQWGRAMVRDAKERLIEKGAYEGLADKGLTDEEAAKERGEIVKGRTVSGSAMGAGIGATLGSFGGPIGIVVGGILGGAAGGLLAWTQAKKEAEKAIQSVRFNHATSKMADAMEQYTNKQITASETMDHVMVAHQQMIANAGGGGVVAAVGGAADVEAAMHTLIADLGKESASAEHFDAKTGASTAVQQALDSGLVSAEYIKNIREEIEVRTEAQEKMQDFVDAQQEAIKQLAHLGQIGNIFDEVGNRVKRFGDIVNAIADPTGGITFGGGIEESLGLSGARDTESIQRFEKAVDRMGNIAGEDARTGLSQDGMAGKVKDTAFMERNMGNILERTSGSNAIDDDFRELIQAELESAADVEGYTISDDMQKHFDSVLMNMDAVELKDKGKMDANVGKFMDSHEKYIDTFRKGAKMLDDHNKNLLTMYAARNKVEMQALAKRQEIISSQYRAEQDYLKGIQGPGVDFMTSQAGVDQQFSKRQMADLEEVGDLGGDVKGTDLAGDVNKIGLAYRAVSKQLIRSNRDIQEQGLKGAKPGSGKSLAEETNAQIAANSKLRKQYELLGNVLNKYKSTQERLIAINEKIAKEAGFQEALEDLAFNLSYGTADEKEESAYLVNQIEKVRAAGTVAAADPEMQRTIGKWMKTSGMEGGQEMVMGDIAKSLNDAGAAFTALGGNFAGITTATERMIELQTAKLEIEQERVSALGAEEGELGDRGQTIKDAIMEANTEFLKGLKTLLMAEKIKETEQEIKIQQGTIDSNGELLNYLSQLGIDASDPRAMDKVASLSSASDKMKEADRLSHILRDQPNIEYLHALVGLTEDGWGVQNDMSDALDGIDNNMGAILAAQAYEDKHGAGSTSALAREEGTAGYVKSRLDPAKRSIIAAGGTQLPLVRLINNLGDEDRVTQQHLNKVELMLGEYGSGKNATINDLNASEAKQWFGTEGMTGQSAMGAGAEGWKGGSGGFIQNIQKQFGELYKDETGESTFYTDMDKIMENLASVKGGKESIRTHDLFEAILADLKLKQQGAVTMGKEAQATLRKEGFTRDDVDKWLEFPPEIRELLKSTDLQKVQEEQLAAINETNKLLGLKAELKGEAAPAEITGEQFETLRTMKAELKQKKTQQAGEQSIQDEFKDFYAGSRRGVDGPEMFSRGAGGEEGKFGGNVNEQDFYDMKIMDRRDTSLKKAWTSLVEQSIDEAKTPEDKQRFQDMLAAGPATQKFSDRFEGAAAGTEQKLAGSSFQNLISGGSWQAQAGGPGLDVLNAVIAEQDIESLRQALLDKRGAEIGQEEADIHNMSKDMGLLTTSATTEGSIFTHDTHVEKILIAMLALMGGGAGLAGGGGGDNFLTSLIARAQGLKMPDYETATGAIQGAGRGFAEGGGLGGMLKTSAVAGWQQLVGGTKTPEEKSASDTGVSLLTAIKDGITTLAGGVSSTGEEKGEGGGLFGTFDTKAFGESIATFSTSANELTAALNSPVKMEVSGKVSMVVKIKGAEVFEDAKDSFTKLVVDKVNTGIKNFVTHMKSSGGNLDGNRNYADGDNQPVVGGNNGD